MTRPTSPAPGPAPFDPGSGGVLLFVDAIEGAHARLLAGEEAFDVPTRLLPPGAKEGAWLRLFFQLAPAPADEGETLRRKLGEHDDGGDIKL